MVVDLRKVTLRDFARYLGVSEAMVHGIDMAYPQKTLGNLRLRDLEIIAIDEIYVGRRNKFVTIVIDWRSGGIVYVCTNKGKGTLNSFWKGLRLSAAKTNGCPRTCCVRTTQPSRSTCRRQNRSSIDSRL